MALWLSVNLGNIIVSLLLIIIVVLIIRSIIKDKRLGRSSCGGNCAHCKMCTACRNASKNEAGIQSQNV